MSEHITTLHVPDKFEVTDALMAGTNKAIGEQLQEIDRPLAKLGAEEEKHFEKLKKTTPKPGTPDQFRWLLYASEGTRELRQNKTFKDSRPTVASYKLHAKNTSLGTTEKALLPVKSIPENPLALYRELETHLQCPFSLIEAFFKEEKLEATTKTTLTELGLHDGARIDVTYKVRCDLEEVRILFNWYRYIAMFLHGRCPNIYDNITSEVGLVVRMGQEEGIAENLAYQKFQPPDSDVAWCNKVYFIQNQGLTCLLTVYEILLSEPWATMVLCLKHVEIGCMRVMAQLSTEDIFQMKVVEDDGVGFCIQSMLRYPLHLCHVIEDRSGSPGAQEYNDFTLRELMAAGVEMLASFRLYPDAQEEMASSQLLLEQFLAIIQCESYTSAEALSAMSVVTCLCLDHLEGLEGMARNVMVDGLSAVPSARKSIGDGAEDVMLMHYYTNMYMCMLMVLGVKFMDLTLLRLKRIQSHVEEFIPMADASVIARKEKAAKGKLGWVDYKPILRLIYLCKFPEDIREAIEAAGKEVAVKIVYLSSIHQQNVKTLAVALTSMLKRDGIEKAIEKLKKNDLLDYVHCVQRMQHKSHQACFDECMATLRSGPPLPVPKLQNLVKAKLARTWLDLDNVLTMTLEEIKKKLTPPPPPPRPKPRPLGIGDAPAMYCVVAVPNLELLKTLTKFVS